MKSIKQLRETFDLITEKEENEERKLTSLVRSGLVDTNKLPLIKRALNKDNRVLTPSERNALMSLLDSLMAQVLSHNNVYQKVKQNVMGMNEELRPTTNRMSDMPSILVLKRRAIRVYPGGQNVGLYYSQQLDRYVAVPFGARDDKDILSMTEETQLDEISNELANKVYSKRQYQADDEDEDEETRELAKYKAGKTFVSHMSKKGPASAIKMKAYYKRYAANKNASKPKTPPPPKPGEPLSSAGKRRDHDNIMKGNMAIDSLSQYGKKHWLGHVVGRAIYRARNKAKEEQVNEVVQFAPVVAAVGAVARGVAGAAARSGPAIARSVSKYLKNRKSTKNKKKKLDKIDKWRAKDKNADSAETNNQNTSQSTGSGSNPKSPTGGPSRTGSGSNPKSPTGGPSRLRVTSSNSFDTHRKRLADLSWSSQTNQPQRQPQMRESINLDGNIFELNSNVAKKVQSVYESLNKKNKKKMLYMMNESEEAFNKVISFAVRH